MSWWVIFLCYRGYLPAQLCRWLIWPVLVSLPLSPVLQAEHLEEFLWLQGVTGRGNVSCCGSLDCVEATVALLDETGGERTVLIGEHEVALPAAWVHPSGGHTGVWCFVPQPGRDGRPLVSVDAHGRTRAIPPAVPTRENTRCALYLAYN